MPLTIKGEIFGEKARGNHMVTWILRMGGGMASMGPVLTAGLQEASGKGIRSEGPLEINGDNPGLSLTNDKERKASMQSIICYHLWVYHGSLRPNSSLWQVKNFHPQIGASPGS